MGVQLNIKNDEAGRLAREIAGTTGESITHVVTEALRAKLRDVRRSKELEPNARREREEAFYAIVDGSRAHWPDFMLSIDLGDLLYDEYGLPR